MTSSTLSSRKGERNRRFTDLRTKKEKKRKKLEGSQMWGQKRRKRERNYKVHRCEDKKGEKEKDTRRFTDVSIRFILILERCPFVSKVIY